MQNIILCCLAMSCMNQIGEWQHIFPENVYILFSVNGAFRVVHVTHAFALMHHSIHTLLFFLIYPFLFFSLQDTVSTVFFGFVFKYEWSKISMCFGIREIVRS